MPRKLLPCPSCERHVLVGEESCPFCDAELPGLRRRTLGALTAVSLGLAVSGCPPRPAPKYGMPPQPPPQPPVDPETQPPDPDAPPPDPEAPQPAPEVPMYGMPSPPPEDDEPGEEG